MDDQSPGGAVGSPARAVRVLIAEDEAPLRAALVDLVNAEDDLEVVGEASDAESAVAAAADAHPGVALVDVRMPGGGLAALRGIVERSPETSVLVLSAYQDRETVLEMLGEGAAGYLVKGVRPPEVVEAVRRAARGQASIATTLLAGVTSALAHDLDELKHAERALWSSEQRFRTLVESAPKAILSFAPEGQIVFANAFAAGVLGYRTDELTNMRVEEILPGASLASLADGSRVAALRRDGTELAVDVVLYLESAESGAPVTAVLSAPPEGSSGQEAGHDQFSLLLEAAPDAVVVVDESGRIVLVNERTEALFGYARADLLGSTVDTLLPERLRPTHRDQREAYFARPWMREMGSGPGLTGLRADGSEFAADISLSWISTPDGMLAFAFVRDVTERVTVEAARRRDLSRFTALLESAPDGVVLTDRDGRIVLVNARVEQMFGYTRRELLERPVDLLLPGRLAQQHAAERAAYGETPQARPMGAGRELVGRRKDGSEFPVDIALSPVEMPEGPMITAFVRDISDRVEQRQLERDLDERRSLLLNLVSAGEEERRRIAGDIHDDSIQAITAAGIRLQLLRRALSDPGQLSLLASLEETIQLSITRLRNLLFELRPPALETEGFSAAVAMYVAQFGTETDARLEFVDRLTTPPSLEVRTILYRIVQEALTNARKHAAAANVTVEAEDRDDGYLVRIRDDGVGFAADSYQPQPGHLGLAAIRERAALAGGWLRIESEPGRGATVEVWLPASIGAENPEKTARL